MNRFSPHKKKPDFPCSVCGREIDKKKDPYSKKINPSTGDEKVICYNCERAEKTGE